MIERTQYVAHCDKCPALADMPTRNLIVGACPKCGRLIDGVAAARVLRGRELAKERAAAWEATA